MTAKDNYMKKKKINKALRIKSVSSTFNKNKKHSNDLIKQFVEKKVTRNHNRDQIEKVDDLK